MSARSIAGIIVAAIGGACLLFSDYIAEQVLEGQQQIDKAEKGVSVGKKLFSVTPVSEPVGGVFTRGAQKKIDAGKQEVAKYTEISRNLKIGGLVLLAVGGVIIILSRKR
ncbi:MAG: hypothetical protein RL235_1041 [Chlamydiota bacterium]|jgi:hypothetical protein